MLIHYKRLKLTHQHLNPNLVFEVNIKKHKKQKIIKIMQKSLVDKETDK